MTGFFGVVTVSRHHSSIRAAMAQGRVNSHNTPRFGPSRASGSRQDGDTIMKDPFLPKNLILKPSPFENSNIWVKGSNKHVKDELKINNKCFVCKSAAHQLKECPDLSEKFFFFKKSKTD
jgi:hypothetical protein